MAKPKQNHPKTNKEYAEGMHSATKNKESKDYKRLLFV